MPNPFAYLSYVMLTTFTPGPNNIMSMSNGRRRGLAGTLPFTLGIFAGFSVVMGLACALSAALFDVLPGVEPYMKVIGAAYILWLAWQQLVAKPHDEQRPAPSSSFVSGALLQLINPKGILYGITAASTFLVPYYHSWVVLGAFCLFMGLVSFVATSSWALFGAGFQRFLGRYHRAVGVLMAALLVYCAASLWLH